MEAEVRVMWLQVPRNLDGPLKLEKTKKWIPPKASGGYVALPAAHYRLLAYTTLK